MKTFVALLVVGLTLVGSCKIPPGGDTNVYLNNLAGPSSPSSGPSGTVVDQVVITPALVETVNGRRFTLTAQPFAGTLPLAGIPILWATSDPSIANIETPSTTGSVSVKAEGVGEADVIARAGAVEGRARVKVRAAN